MTSPKQGVEDHVIDLTQLIKTSVKDVICNGLERVLNGQDQDTLTP